MGDHAGRSSLAAADIYRSKCGEALQHLQGIIDGVMSDGRLEPREVQFLDTWLKSHPEATADWPGSVLHRKVRQILADGLTSPSELGYLHEALSHLASTVFDEAPGTQPEAAHLPIDDTVAVNVRESRICLAGAFLFGTRAACERLIVSAGGVVCDRVSTMVDCLVIGTRASASWSSQPCRADIEEAVALRHLGHHIAIISERRLLESLR
jgi:hypothetical protein